MATRSTRYIRVRRRCRSSHGRMVDRAQLEQVFSRSLRLIVYNPRGGAAIWGSRLRAALRVLESLPGAHRSIATESTDMAGPIRRALAAHPDITTVIACGGDGTVAACADAIGDRDIPIGVVPTGTTNVLAF